MSKLIIKGIKTTAIILFLTIVLLEVVLNILGFLYSENRLKSHKINSVNSNSIRVIFFGESTTAYGGDSSFPSRIKKSLNEKILNYKVEVINQGVPAINTKRIYNEILKPSVDEYKPHIAVLMMGINDVWGIEENFFKNKNQIILWKSLDFFKTTKLFKILLINYIVKRNEKNIAQVNGIESKDRHIEQNPISYKRASVSKLLEYLERVKNDGILLNIGSLDDSLANYNKNEFNEIIVKLDLVSDDKAIRFIENLQKQAFLNKTKCLVSLLEFIESSNDLKLKKIFNCLRTAREYYEVAVLAQEIKRYNGLEFEKKVKPFYQKAFVLNPKSSLPHFKLGMFYESFNYNLEKAREYFISAYNLAIMYGDNLLEIKEPLLLMIGQFVIRTHFEVDFALADKVLRDQFEKALLREDFIFLATLANLQISKNISSWKPYVDRADERMKNNYFYFSSVDARDSRKFMGDFGEPENMYKNPLTIYYYREIVKYLLGKGIQVVAVQYPNLKIEPLRDMLYEFQDRVIFVDNFENYKKKLEEMPYDEIFFDRFGGSFGHFNDYGYQIMADSIEPKLIKIIREDFK